MRTYDYKCDFNERVIEVRHSMADEIRSWGELCQKAGIDPGTTPSDTPVHKLATGGQIVKSGRLGETTPPCGQGPCCGGGCSLM
ncbi:MAG: zinc ribbon domain-containing protein [Gammaproteobacteria bacterium]|nr:zinc ribbon domain-containing protein [Gammaproteobacteria bacterium]